MHEVSTTDVSPTLTPDPSPSGRGEPPILIVALERGVQAVKHCCERAARSGVLSGMTLAHARALLDQEPQVEAFDPQRDLQSLHRLAMWAQRYSPIVAVDPPDGLLIDITGCQRVFKGEERLARTMLRDLNRLGFQAHVAIASTCACAAAVARDERHEGTKARRHGGEAGPNHFVPSRLCAFVPDSIIPSGHERAALTSLPLETLRIAPDIIEALHEVEIVRIGQLFDLPRGQLADRYGDELLLRLDQALGEALEAIEPVRLKTPPSEQHVFEGPVLQIEGIELMTRSLVERLAEQLLKLERGVCRLDVEFKRIDVAPIRVSIRLSHPSRNVKHLWSLLRPKIENINLGFGVEEITVIASRSRILPHQQMDAEHRMIMRRPAPDCHPVLGSSSQFHTIYVSELIDTLSNRLRADRVLCAELFESHVPERSLRMSPAIEISQSTIQNPHRRSAVAESKIDCVDRPTILLARPELISVAMENELPSRLAWHGMEHSLVESIGPEAIASEWWKESPSGLREYYKVQDEQGRWMWIFYQHANERWFIHGVWA